MTDATQHAGSTDSARSATIPVVALVGNPNTGKTSIFNLLTGGRQKVANYPGVTVERITGRLAGAVMRVDVLDLPGAYSLAARSPDEQIVCDALVGSHGDAGVSAVVVVADASNLERNLYLATQVLELGRPVVIALNMMDVAERRGVEIDHRALGDELGVEVLPLVARTGQGRDRLVAAIERALQTRTLKSRGCWPAGVEQQFESFQRCVARLANGQPVPHSSTLNRCLIDADGSLERQLVGRFGPPFARALQEHRLQIEQTGFALPHGEADIRYARIRDCLAKCVTRVESRKPTWTERIDNWVTHRVLGVLIFVAVMTTMFVGVFAWAQPLMDVVESGFGWLAAAVGSALGPGILSSFLADGVIAGVGGVLVFLPQILILFGFITLLEDSGYLARAAFLMDRVFRSVGMGGRSFVPLLSSFACAIPGVMAARTIEHPRSRLITILIAPLMSCSARIPVYAIMVAAFVPRRTIAGFLSLQGLVFASMYFLGIVVAAVTAVVLNRTLLRGQDQPFLLELPEYRRPALRNVLYRMYDRGRVFVVNAGTIILAMSVVIWALAYFPRPAELGERIAEQLAADGVVDEATVENAVAGAYLRQSYLGRAGHFIEPAVKPLGWDWRIGLSTLAAFPAREVIISTLGIVYNLGPEVDDSSEHLRDRLRAATWPDGSKVYTLPVALSIMVFFALCCQCQATVAVIKRETNSWRWPIFVFVYMTALAYVGAMLVYQVGSRTGA